MVSTSTVNAASTFGLWLLSEEAVSLKVNFGLLVFKPTTCCLAANKGFRQAVRPPPLL